MNINRYYNVALVGSSKQKAIVSVVSFGCKPFTFESIEAGNTDTDWGKRETGLTLK